MFKASGETKIINIFFVFVFQSLETDIMQEVGGTPTTTELSNLPNNTAPAATNPVDDADSNTSNNGVTAPPAQPAPAQESKVKKKRANPVYITPIRRERKRSCSDSDNEDGITGDDSAWGPGGKKRKGKKKGAGGGKGKGRGKKKKNDDSD